MAKCKNCGHQSYTHNLISGRCEVVTFHDVMHEKGKYSYHTKSCGCVIKID